MIYTPYGIDGEVKRRFLGYGFLYVALITAMVNILPAILIMLPDFNNSIPFKVFAAIWYFWLIISLGFIKKFNLFDLKLKKINFLFPVSVVNCLASQAVVYFLKKKHPNSDDPVYLKQFERKKKIKIIL